MAVSGPHEVIIELLTTVPDLLPRLVESASGQPLTYTTVQDCSEAATMTVPVEHRSDAVRVFLDSAGKATLAVIIEVQLEKDPRKEWTWPVYLAEARRMHRCPTVLLIVTPQTTTAHWARQRLDLGLGLSLMVPLVYDLSRFDPVADAHQAAANIGEAMLGMFGKSITTEQMDELNKAFAILPVEDAKQYSGLMLTALQGAARDYWRKLMATGTYAYQNEYAREIEKRLEKQVEQRLEKQVEQRVEKQVEQRIEKQIEQRIEKQVEQRIRKEVEQVELRTRRDTLYRNLAGRDVTVTDQARQRIDNCDDTALFESWAARVGTVTTIDELFDDPSSTK